MKREETVNPINNNTLENINVSTSERKRKLEEYLQLLGLQLDSKVFLTLKPNSKEPSMKFKDHSKLLTIKEISHWNGNIGLVLPEPYIVIDIDAPYKIPTQDGTLKINPTVKRILQHLPTKDTLMVLTRHKGLHIYFKILEKKFPDYHVDPKIGWKIGIDLRSWTHNNYIIAPTSQVPIDPEYTKLINQFGYEPQEYKIINTKPVATITYSDFQRFFNWYNKWRNKINQNLDTIFYTLAENNFIDTPEMEKVKLLLASTPKEKRPRLIYIHCPFHPPDKTPSLTYDYFEGMFFDNHTSTALTINQMYNALIDLGLLQEEEKVVEKKKTSNVVSTELSDTAERVLNRIAVYYVSDIWYEFYDHRWRVSGWSPTHFILELEKELNRVLTPREKKELKEWLKLHQTKPKQLGEYWLGFGPTIVNIRTLQTINSTPDYKPLIHLDIPLNKQEFDGFVNGVNGISFSDFLRKMENDAPNLLKYIKLVSDDWLLIIGLLAHLFTRNHPQSLFLVHGPGGSGKTLFFNSLFEMLPQNAFTLFDASMLTERFETLRFQNKLIGVFNEFHYTSLTEKMVKSLEKLTGGEWHRAEGKNVDIRLLDKIKIESTIVLIFNDLPSLPSTISLQTGLWRRLQMISFPRKFSSKFGDVTPLIRSIWKEEFPRLLPYLVVIAHMQNRTGKILGGLMDTKSKVLRFVLSDPGVKWFLNKYGFCPGNFVTLNEIKTTALKDGITFSSRTIDIVLPFAPIEKVRKRLDDGTRPHGILNIAPINNIIIRDGEECTPTPLLELSYGGSRFVFDQVTIHRKEINIDEYWQEVGMEGHSGPGGPNGPSVYPGGLQKKIHQSIDKKFFVSFLNTFQGPNGPAGPTTPLLQQEIASATDVAAVAHVAFLTPLSYFFEFPKEKEGEKTVFSIKTEKHATMATNSTLANSKSFGPLKPETANSKPKSSFKQPKRKNAHDYLKIDEEEAVEDTPTASLKEFSR